MHNVANKYVFLSDITSYLICPRLAFFRRRGRSAATSPDTAVSAESVRAAVFKEVSRSLSGVIGADDPGALLRSYVEVACSDAEIVYGLPTEEIVDEATGCVDAIVAGLAAESARMGRDRLWTMIDPAERAQTMYSDRLRIAGTVDRIARLDGARCPVVVCASRPPEHGIYAADRVKLAACAMLVEEKYGEAVDHGAVEYTCGWRIREADVRKADRMAVLSTRNRIVQMGSAMPEGKRGPWCPRCDRSGSCEVRPSLLSSLFRPVLINSISLSRNETNK